MKIRERLFGLRERLLFRYAPPLARWLIHYSTVKARQKLKESGALSILVDNTVLSHAITHETAWISTGTKRWGPHEVSTGYAARIPAWPVDDDSPTYQSIQYLAGIAALARDGLISLKTSAELIAERFRQPSGRFSGYGYFDYDVFGDIEIESIDGHPEMMVGSSWG